MDDGDDSTDYTNHTDLRNVVAAVDRVREAVGNQHTWVSSVFWVWIAWSVFSYFQDSVWESKFRYATYYGVTNEQVTLVKKPHAATF